MRVGVARISSAPIESVFSVIGDVLQNPKKNRLDLQKAAKMAECKLKYRWLSSIGVEVDDIINQEMEAQAIKRLILSPTPPKTQLSKKSKANQGDINMLMEDN